MSLPLQTPWSCEADEIVSALASDAQRGLSSEEARERLRALGENRIRPARRLRFVDVLWEEVREPLILLLIAIGILYGLTGNLGDALTILAIILLLACVEVLTELRAKRSLEALKRLTEPTALVVRNALPSEAPVREIVAGDLLPLSPGRRVAADARVASSRGLAVDESQLTGESVAVEKGVAPLARATPPAERTNMVHLGSLVVRGSGSAVVTATGMESEVGRIARLTAEVRESKTPLQLDMKRLSALLVWVALGFSLLIPIAGILRGMAPRQMVLTGLSLAFATIPEELPVIITMVLGAGGLALARQGILLRRLRAAETLGSVTVIATDKTGTLTSHAMELRAIGGPDEEALLEAACVMAAPGLTAASTESPSASAGTTGTAAGGRMPSALGDPIDRALLAEAARRGVTREALQGRYELLDEDGFDPVRKLYSQRCRLRGDLESVLRAPDLPERAFPAADLPESIRPAPSDPILFVKGAPEAVCEMAGLPAPPEEARRRAEAGERVVAFARARGDESLRLLGFASFANPLRPGVGESIAAATEAGIRVLMLTGDHPGTARAVAREAGLRAERLLEGKAIASLDSRGLSAAVKQTDLFARIAPEQKLAVVHALRARGEVVAVTGDGVNDAPALKAADVGVAMGASGSDVAREAADLILTDDSFPSIVAAIHEGRRLFDNLSKCITYYLACKIALVLSFAVPLALGIPFPFAPVQIILLELFMDLAAATTFVIEPAEGDLLRQAPRPAAGRRRREQVGGGRPRSEPLLGRPALLQIGFAAVTLAAVVLPVFLAAWYATGDLPLARTLAFASWLVGHLFLAATMRSARRPFFRIALRSNPAFLLWALGVGLFLALVLSIKAIQDRIALAPAPGWMIAAVIGWALVAVAWLEVRKLAPSR